MNKFSFVEGLCLALIASVCGTLLLFALAPLFTLGFLFKLIVNVIGFGNILYLLIRAPRRIGRITAFTVWALLATLGWLFIDSILVLIGLHLTMIWLIRSVYFYTSPSAALVDLGLCGLSLAAAVRVFSHTGSLALGIWCLFLIQALVSMIPSDFKRTMPAQTAAKAGSDRFDRACRSAERALRKLS